MVWTMDGYKNDRQIDGWSIKMDELIDGWIGGWIGRLLYKQYELWYQLIIDDLLYLLIKDG